MSDSAKVAPTASLTTDYPEPEMKDPTKTIHFLTPNLTKSIIDLESEDQTSRSKKYPETWKLFVLPEIKQKSVPKSLNRSSEAAATMRNSLVSYKGTQFLTPQPGDHTNKHSRVITQASEMNQEDVGIDRVTKLHIPERMHAPEIRAKSDRVMAAVERHHQWTGRIVLENEYQREESDYLREMFSRCLIRKYKPGSETLY